MDKKKLAIGILLLAAVPLVLFNVVKLVEGYLPIAESYKKTPYQFEEAFNEQMAVYGMSIDVDSVNFTYGGSYPYKVVPIQCEDDSQITCTYYPTSERRKSLMMGIEFKQQLTGDVDETIYIEPILEFLLEEFETPMLEDKDRVYSIGDSISYNQAIEKCNNFIIGSDEQLVFYIAVEEDYANAVTLKRESGDCPGLIVRLHLFS